MARRNVAALIFVVLGAMSGAGAPAGAATRTVNFDDLVDDTRVESQYYETHGVAFPASSWFRPQVKSVPGKARSGSNWAIYACETRPGSPCGEGFSAPRLHGVLRTTASAVSAYVGLYEYPGYEGIGTAAQVRIVAYDANGAEVASSAYATVAPGAPMTQQVTATTPAATIAAFEVVADMPGDEGKAIAIDDLAITTPDAAPPPDFTLNPGETVVDVLTGTSVDVPLDLNRINGSNGDISFTVSGLPAGMTAAIAPNPLTGTSATATLRLTVDAGAASSDQYTEITLTATPGPGAGSSARSTTKLVRIRENCERTVRFQYVDARSSGCMVRRGKQRLATDQEVRINGLIIKPADDSRPTLVIDDQAKTVKGQSSTMPFLVSIDSAPDIPIYAGPVDWSFGGAAEGARKVVRYDGSKIKRLKGIPVAGLDVSFLPSGKSQITPTLNLTFWPFSALFGGVTTNTRFTTDNDRGADFSGLEIKVGSVNAVALELKDVELAWQRGEDGETWSGSANVVLKFAKAYTIGAGFGIKNGGFDYLRGSVGGLNVGIGPAIFLQSIGFEVRVSPLSLAGSVGLSAGPSIAGESAVTVNGTLKATFDDPFVIEVNGGAKVADRYEIADAFLRYSSTGLFEFGGAVDVSLWNLSLNGSVEGWVAGLTTWNVEGQVKACLSVWGPDPCGGARLGVSTKGVGGCLGVFGYYVGAGTRWSPFAPDAFTGCDLSPYTETRPRGGAARTRFALPKGVPLVAWEIRGDGTLPGPGVTVTGPAGQRVTVTKDVPLVVRRRIRAQLLDDGTALVLVARPAAGVWTVAGDGTVPVTSIRQARGLPKPRIAATVTGSGRKRRLGWRIQPIRGQTVTFAEVGRDVRSAILTGAVASGSRPFRPADGPAGRRRIVALVQQNGLPRRTLVVGSYRAPGMRRPGRPRGLKVVRKGTRLVVSFRPRPAGFRHAVHLRLTDGRRLLRIVAPRRRSLAVAVPRNVGARVTLRDLSALNAPGPAARAAIGPVRPRRR